MVTSYLHRINITNITSTDILYQHPYDNRHSDQWVLLTNELEADVESLVGGGGGESQTGLNNNR